MSCRHYLVNEYFEDLKLKLKTADGRLMETNVFKSNLHLQQIFIKKTSESIMQLENILKRKDSE